MGKSGCATPIYVSQHVAVAVMEEFWEFLCNLACLLIGYISIRGDAMRAPAREDFHEYGNAEN
ncbi:MAG: hypothetical protein ABSE07_11335 [Methanoregula sp.]